jgi:hypothetical protein
MSFAQIQEILNDAQPSRVAEANPRQSALYFTYGGHLCFIEFKEKYPDAQALGVGYLQGWTWHINALGDPFLSPLHRGLRA